MAIYVILFLLDLILLPLAFLVTFDIITKDLNLIITLIIVVGSIVLIIVTNIHVFFARFMLTKLNVIYYV